MKTPPPQWRRSDTPGSPHLADTGDAGHHSAVEEIKLLASFAEEEVNLIIGRVAALPDVGRSHEGGVCGVQSEQAPVRGTDAQKAPPSQQAVILLVTGIMGSLFLYW